MKRIFWSLGVGLGGFFIGGMGGGPAGAALGFVWAACIGYGFGSIVSNDEATKWVLIYWGLTLALLGAFFGLVAGAPPEPSVGKEAVVGGIGAAVGALCGSLIGMIQLFWRLRRKSQTRHSDPVA